MNWKTMEPWSLSMAGETSDNRRCQSFWQRRFSLMNHAIETRRAPAFVPLVLIAIFMLPAVQLTTREVMADEHHQSKVEKGTAVPPLIHSYSTPMEGDAHLKATRQRNDRIVVTVEKMRMIAFLILRRNNDEKNSAIELKEVEDGKYSILTKQTGTFKINSNEGDVTIVSVVDSSALQARLKSEGFANVHVTPGIDGVVLSGNVETTRDRDHCVQLAKDHFESVGIQIGIGDHQILIECELIAFTCKGADPLDELHAMETIPRQQAIEGLSASVLKDDAARETLRGSLKRVGKIETLSKPMLVTQSGRPASIQIRRKIPIMTRDGETVSVDYGEFGHRIDFVPTSLGNGMVRLECRPHVTELDTTKSVKVDGQTIPGLRTRFMDIAVEIPFGNHLVAIMRMSEPDDKEQRFVLAISNARMLTAKASAKRTTRR
ncbi:hypothetical protein ACFL2H_05920 [Planctomycetota bacterium]